jgi:hypothetical protein
MSLSAGEAISRLFHPLHVKAVKRGLALHALQFTYIFNIVLHIKFLLTSYIPVLPIRLMLGGSLVTTAWRVFRLWMEEMASRYGG